MEFRNGNYILTNEELNIFERFFQYGNYEKAKYIFVGIEEGLCRNGYKAAIESRLLLASKYKNEIEYFNKNEGIKAGWYVNNSELLPRVEHEVINPKESLQEYLNGRALDFTMRMHIRLAMLLESPMKDGRLDFSGLDHFRKKAKHYKIHAEESQTAMFDFFPLPKQGKFPYIVNGKFENEKEYRAYYLTNKSNERAKLIRTMYDQFPMNISFVYTGISRGKFKVLQFYEEVLGFQFKETYTTGRVHEEYRDVIEPSTKPKPFMIGKRSTGQIAVLTPFLGPRQMGYNDLNVVATWLHDVIANK